MKFKFSTNLLVNIVIIAFVGLLVFTWASFYFGPKSFTGTGYLNKNEGYSYSLLKPFDQEIPDSTTYRKYDSLKQEKEAVRLFRNGVWPHEGGPMFAWFLATDGGLICDTCTVYRPLDHGKFMPDPGTRQYYIKLPAWQLKSQDYGRPYFAPQFHVEHSQSYVRKFLSDKVLKKGNGTDHSLEQVDVPVKFRYNSKDNVMLIPVSSGTKHFVSGLLFGLIALFGGWFYYLVASFLKFIIDISKGLTFTAKNVNRLRLIGFSLIGFPVLMMVLPFVARLIFSSYFTDDIVLKKEVWNQSWQMLSAGIVFLLLFRAFSQGKALKEEQELTV
ncbi:DUF2975 domain-containing protein [Mucilaginibacter sp. dw_454]|uniref:DUF2975 domain-containing protein n=1 Tax=Mucilaginibacter sp. dw_454 TaxID=2720079 RepID=UPI001BD338BA|nr:DUF2975 domain-containing protein [Mucilaginibacter sp. dw_454]